MSVKSPGVDARPLPAWGFYARNVDVLEFDNVRLRCEKEDLRPVLMCDGVKRLTLDGLRFRRSAEAADPLVLDHVEQLEIEQSDVSLVQPQLRDVKLSSQDDSGRFVAGGKYTISVTAENGNEKGLARQTGGGLAKVELTVAGQTTARWVWLRAGEKKGVVFAGLVAPEPGKHEVRAGDLTTDLVVEDRQ